jgi:hypothetical protein
MNSDNKTLSIKQILDDSSRQLSPVAIERLRVSRTLALDHQRTYTSPVMAWVGAHSGNFHTPRFSKSANLAFAVLFIACLFSGLAYWQSYSKERDIVDVDIAILTDDMPINVYLD